MLELIFCSLFTIVPDFLYRYYRQGKRIRREITIYSVWYELRWGLTGCVILTVLLITIIFYNHPSTSNAVSFFRTVPVLPETPGRVAEIYVNLTDKVKEGQKLFRLDSSKQEAALATAQKRIAEIEAAMIAAKSDIVAAEGQIEQARSALQQATDELQTKQELVTRNAGIVAEREIERLTVAVEGKKGALKAAAAAKEATEIRLSTQLPAQKASAEAEREQAQVDLDKTTIYAGTDGTIEQFVLKVGDFVNPFMRPAGILIPASTGKRRLHAGFGQIEAQIMQVGMVAEATCISKPLAIIPLVVTDVQDYIAAGQFRASEQLIDLKQVAQPGTITVFLEPLFNNGLDDVTPGSSCIVNAYSNNHSRLANEDLGFLKRVYLHIVDTVALVHALILRAQALLLPIKTLVFSGGH